MELEKLFTDKDSWTGGFYELAIEVGERSNSRLQAALRTVWEYPALQGCWLNRNIEPLPSLRVSPALSDDGPAHFQGIATLPNGRRTACGTCVIRESTDESVRNIDWLDFYIPMGSLARAYAVGGFPFGVADSGSWRQPLDEWLVRLGQHVFTRVPYQLALVGHEVSGETYSDELAAVGLPSDRWIGYLRPTDGKLEWYPPSRY